MAYLSQSNGSAERMDQTATRVLKMYVQDRDQRDWDEYAERSPSRSTPQGIGSEVKPLSTWYMGALVGTIEIREGGDIGCKSSTSKPENK
ncbi:reverse transcriptase [Phytophthora megakarya]|uniref:Reverse transcriptase n=1 Tax=Phytophthora megakarya TaxID=4795 RepID=A0A225UZ14_9STRA|nr:reverse transcriptase [Phytophthora megakarya]